jgi:hypothetical protein
LALDVQGALDEEQGKSSSIGFPGQVVGSMRFEVETDGDEEGKGIDLQFVYETFAVVGTRALVSACFCVD